MLKKKQRYRPRVKEFGLALLAAIHDGMDLVQATPRDLSLAIRMGGLDMVYDERAERRKDSRRRAIKTLARNHLVRVIGKESNQRYEMTTDGRILWLREVIIGIKKKMPGGLLCLISFDIPERERMARRTIRNLLKAARCRQYHASLWGTRKNIVKPLLELIDLLHVEEWVSIFEAKQR